jgi:hypothetical protein
VDESVFVIIHRKKGTRIPCNGWSCKHDGIDICEREELKERERKWGSTADSVVPGLHSNHLMQNR